MVPHANLRARDEERLAEDPEEYARVNAVGDVAIVDAIEEALADGGGSGSGVTARNAALEFVQALVTTVGPAGDGAEPRLRSTRRIPRRIPRRMAKTARARHRRPRPGSPP